MTGNSDSDIQREQNENPKHKMSPETDPDSGEDTAKKTQRTMASFQDQLSAAKLPKETRDFMRSRLIAANFGNIVTVLMQSADHKDRKLSDLRTIVVPALLNNQFRVAEAHKKGSGNTIPVGVILWARVSEDVDKRLSDTELADVQLTTEDWVSGEQLWIVEVVGEQRFIASMLQDLQKKEFKGKAVKYRRKTDDGIIVSTLDMEQRN